MMIISKVRNESVHFMIVSGTSHVLVLCPTLAAAMRSREEVQKRYTKPIVTEVSLANKWYPAEEHHQQVCCSLFALARVIAYQLYLTLSFLIACQYLSKGGQCSRTGDLTPIRCYG